MDPLTLASSFATLVGLICNFKQERKDQAQTTKDDFINWLNDHQHYKIKKHIEENVSLCKAIESLLKQNHETVLKKIEFIDEQLSSLLSRIAGFDQIVLAINPSCKLSEQAISLLRQLDNTNAEGMLKIKSSSETFLMPLSGGRGSFKIDEQRFLEDDLNILVSLGLLNLNYNSKGNEIYGITRQAVKLIETLNKEQQIKS